MTVDSLRLESVIPAGYPQNAHQRRALIQALIAEYVHEISF